MSPRARDIKERINKWDLIKMKIFCKAKEKICYQRRGGRGIIAEGPSKNIYKGQLDKVKGGRIEGGRLGLMELG